ncbi:restriction endonuclease subunit S [Streptococcus suis]|uniref:restriction endonuclease subunit S n=1 Tax=Streptococcus suis TaxID=1307 RepID=UPI001ABD1B06|nr:restriction endonuclease subunit S [Streptococcus suis]MBO3642085.1 restriction endonuclease subunit S [Streptococcus suis]
MPNKDRNIPKRRFKAFENADAWELRKLGEIGAVAMCRRIFKEQTSEIGEIPFYKIGTFGGTPDAFISKELFEEYRNKYPYPTKGDILISASGSIGRTVEFLGKDEYFQDSNIVWLKHDGKIDNIFLKQFYSIVKWSGVEGSTIKRLYNENILNTEIALPSLLEQKAIGTFFSTLDRQITLHQRKLDKLKNVKQAYLSEMFPAEGERVPKRRFPGFTDAWELRKLGEVVYRSNITSSSKVLPRLEFEDINSGLGTLNKDIFQKVNDDRKGLEFNEGDVLFGKLRPYLKNWWYAEFNGIALGDFWNLKSDVWHSCFLYTYIQSNAFQLVANDTSGTKMPRSDWNLVAESIAKFPSLPEQSAIGTFFSTLDSQITLHQRKLEKLKNLKKALLNELFV